MKYIRDYKLFESKVNYTRIGDIKNDIEGILIELIDDKFYVDVKMNKYVILKDISSFNTISLSNNNDRRYSCVTITIRNSKKYNTNDIEDYVLTVIDYLKTKWGDKIPGYKIPDRLEKTFYTFDGRWTTYSEFPKNIQLRQFVVCIRKY